MSTLQMRLFVNPAEAFDNFGEGVPQWYNNWGNSWGFSSAGHNYGMSRSGSDIFIQYGQKIRLWATNRFFIYSAEILNERINNDNSITARIRLTPKQWTSAMVNPGRGVNVVYDTTIGGRRAWTHVGRSTDVFTKGALEPYEVDVTIPPKGTSQMAALHIRVTYPQGEYGSNETGVGIELYNPLENKIKPWAVRKSGIFKTLSRPSGFFRIRKSNTWVDKSWQIMADIRKPNAGSSRIRKGGIWLGQNKIGEE